MFEGPEAEVERAAVDSALALAPINANGVGTMLGKAIKLVAPRGARRSSKRSEAGRDATGCGGPPRARALKDPDVGTPLGGRAGLLCPARKNALGASPYLRIAAVTWPVTCERRRPHAWRIW